MQNNKAVIALVASLVVVSLSVPVFAASKVKVLHRFTGRDGSNPVAGLTFDAAGGLYGTTQDGGAQNCGTVFKLTLDANGT